jgi:hypothetical protein
MFCRKEILFFGWMIWLGAVFLSPDTFSQASVNEEAVRKLHRQAVVWDCHNDLAYRVLYEGLDIGRRLPGGHVDIPRLKEGEVDVQVVALFIQNYLYPDKAARQCFQLIEALKPLSSPVRAGISRGS